MFLDKCVLIIDDDHVNVQVISKMLSDKYKIYSSTSAKEGFELLKNNQEEIDIILLDIIMPEMNGFDFMIEMKKNNIDKIPVIIMTADDEIQKEVDALKGGAADFIRKPVYKEVLENRINNAVIRNRVEYDALTGLYNRDKCFKMIKEFIKKHPGEKLAMVRYDIDNFSLYNSSMGEGEGNRLLKGIAKALRGISKIYDEVIYGRIEGDVFVNFEVYDEAALKDHLRVAQKLLSTYRDDYHLEASFGVFVFDDPNMSVETAYTNASLAANSCKGVYDKYFAYYDQSMSDKFKYEQEVVNDMTRALENKEFVPYYQPKYELDENTPNGAEALIRWNHPTKGIIPPANFIPIFENNGFIAKVDRYMWECVCKAIRGWLDKGIDVHPISVNVSRISMHNPNILEIFLSLLDKYQLESKYLQLEITESAYMTNPTLMKNTITKLQQAGFVILMDDFGSGYSSLNTLKDINVDILKIDMNFLPKSNNTSRGEKILSSIIRMSGWLGIPTIAEGVETQEERDFLKSIGCDYIQGYFYAKPMTGEEYEKIILEAKPLKIPTITSGEEGSIASWSSDKKITDLLASINLPVAIVEYSNERTQVIRYNDIFKGMLDADLSTILSLEDRKKIKQLLDDIKENNEIDGEVELVLKNGERRIFSAKVKLIDKTKMAKLLCVILVDITREKEYEAKLSKINTVTKYPNRILVIDDSEEAREIIKSVCGNDYEIIECNNGEEALEMLEKYHYQFSTILLDMVMPIMDGKQFMQEVYNKEISIPIIIITAEDSQEIEYSAYDLGVADFIVKPFDSTLLKKKVDNIARVLNRRNN